MRARLRRVIALSALGALLTQRNDARLACSDQAHRWRGLQLLAWARANGGDIMLTEDVVEAVDQVQSVVTDVWVSMGQEGGSQQQDLAAYQVNEQVMKRAAGDAIFMHCLPAKRGLEVSVAVIDGPQSVVFDEAENRLHAQKAILAWCVAGDE